MKYLPQIREMGVSRLVIDGIEVDLRPVAATPVDAAPLPPVTGRDPLTMGLPRGMSVPSLRDRHG